jgi:tetratricopeptide (TPR) repeat protein
MKATKNQAKAAADAAASSEAAGEVKAKDHVPWRLVFSVDVQIFSFLVLIASCIFSNGIRGELTFDDHLAIENNPDAWADKTSLSHLFYDDFWGKSLDRLESNGSYRPITVLTFRIQHWLMGYRHSPVFLHCFNYLVAFLNVCLVFYLARLYVYVAVPSHVLSIDKANTQSLTAMLTSPLHAVPLVCSLLYLVHPVHVDAVTSIVGRCELLYCFFGLVGFFCVHRYLNEADEPATAGRGRHGALPANAGKRPARPPSCSSSSPRVFTTRYVVFSVYALFLSILSKDSAVTFTAVYGVHACVMHVCGRCGKRRMLVVIGVAVLELVSYLAFRRSFIGNVDLEKSVLLRQTENPQYFVPKGLFHWISIRWVIQVKNMELLFFPTSLCCEYSFNCIPHLFNLQDPRVPYFTAVTVVVVSAVLAFLYGSFVRRSRLAIVGLAGFLWIAIPYAPVSHLFIAVGTFIAERCLYVPSIGAVLLITYLVAAAGLRRGVVPHYFYLLLLLCVGWGVFAHQRNNDWHDDERLFRAALRTCPNSGKVRTQLAALISMREHRVTPEIVELSQRSVELDPGLRDGYYYLAIHEVNNKRNVRQAYEYLRLCLGDPFAVQACRETYNQVRRMLFPALTEVEQLVDDASLISLDSQKALALRQAAIFALQKEQKPCLAEALLEDALNLWNSSNMYWISDQVHREAGEQTYCNAMYWYPHSMALCEAASEEDGNSSGSSDDDSADAAAHASAVKAKTKYDTLKKPGFPDAAEAARKAVELAERLRPCNTDWHHVLKEPKYYRPSYPFRMTQFLTVSGKILNALEHYLNFTARDTPERTAVLLAVMDVAVRQYCHISDLVNDMEVRERVSGFFAGQLHALEHGFSEFRQSRLPQMRAARRELKFTKSLSTTQEAELREILEASKCSEDLSFLSL